MTASKKVSPMAGALTIAQEMEAIYALADKDSSLPALLEAIFEMLPRHQAQLQGITYSYRLRAVDTGYTSAFALTDGHFSLLSQSDHTDVTLSGEEMDLLLVFQRKLSPMVALLRRKVKTQGNQAALLKLASFL